MPSPRRFICYSNSDIGAMSMSCLIAFHKEFILEIIRYTVGYLDVLAFNYDYVFLLANILLS